LAPTGQISPGAVPGISGIAEAPSGTSAWRRLFAAISRRRDANSAVIRSTSSALRTSGTPMTSAIASRVMSSWVGPKPPHRMTASLRSSAWRMQPTMRPRLSPTLVWKYESMPASASRAPIQAELVSTIWPSSSSVPMATTSQRMSDFPGWRRTPVCRDFGRRSRSDANA
jgi:hypothetical protein